MKRAVVFAHFDRQGLIDPYVKYYLAALKQFAELVVFVSTSARSAELDKLRSEGLAEIAITRPNTGYDFVSWKTGFGLIEDKASYDEVLFVNDSVYGPVGDLAPLFQRMNGCDFWGLTVSHEIRPHLQSYWFAFSRELIGRHVADRFWQQVDVIEDKRQLIEGYEVGLTDYIFKVVEPGAVSCIFDQQAMSLLGKMRAGLVNGTWRGKSRYKVFTSTMRGRTRNPCHHFWRTTLEMGVPTVKVELMRDNPECVDLAKVAEYLKGQTSYPVELIRQHLARVAPESAALAVV